MTDKLSDLIKSQKRQKFATDAGDLMHKKLQFVVIDGDFKSGDAELIKFIKSNQELPAFFSMNAKTEIPIAGKIGDKFISRRIDRMIINESEKIIQFIDYKTDLDNQILRDKYLKQLSEYKQLLIEIYPDYKIIGYILWTHDWKLEQMI